MNNDRSRKSALNVFYFQKFFLTLRKHKYEFVLFTGILTYISVFSYFLMLKHFFFETYAWDLGTLAQALYTTLYSGKFLYQTGYLFALPNGSFFGIHCSPFLLLLLPIYAIWPNPLNLLIIKTIAIGLAAYPLYRLAFEINKSEKIACAVSILYLLHPALHGANWFDFQPQSFFPLIIFTMQYAYVAKRWKLYLVSAILGSIITEHTALIITLFAIINWIELIFLRRKSNRILKTVTSKNCLIILLALFTSLAIFLVGEAVISSYNFTPEFEGYIRAYSNWRVIGEKVDILHLPLCVIKNPRRAFKALLYDYHIKFLYVIILFGSLLFVPFGSIYSLIALLILIPSFLSNYRAYYTIGVHYPLYILPAIFVATAHSFNVVRNQVRTLLAVMMFFTLSITPLLPPSYTFVEEGRIFWYPKLKSEVDDRIESLHSLISLIPTNTSVVTQNHIFTHVCNRPNAYVIPLDRVYQHDKNATKEYIDYLLNRSEFILLDLTRQDITANYTLLRALNQSFSVYALKKKAVLLKRNYKGIPLFSDMFDYMILTPDKLIVGNQTEFEFDEALNKEIAHLSKGLKGFVTYGPYMCLPSGVYRATFSLRAENLTSNRPILIVDIVDQYGKEVIARKTLFEFEFKEGKWTNISLVFSNAEKLRYPVEFRVYSLGRAEIFFDQVTVERISKSATVNSGQIRFTYTDLIEKDGVIEDYMIVKDYGKRADFVWLGPYIRVPAGKYRVRYHLIVYPPEEEVLGNDTIIVLDIVYKRGTVKVREITLDSKSIGSSTRELDIESTFILNRSVKDLEFRGRNASNHYRIELIYIELIPEFDE
ncbi:MAG: DUF2079 domain-containing protein [Candidatus Njordarchaeales archaeon]